MTLTRLITDLRRNDLLVNRNKNGTCPITHLSLKIYSPRLPIFLVTGETKRGSVSILPIPSLPFCRPNLGLFHFYISVLSRFQLPCCQIDITLHWSFEFRLYVLGCRVYFWNFRANEKSDVSTGYLSGWS